MKSWRDLARNGAQDVTVRRLQARTIRHRHNTAGWSTTIDSFHAAGHHNTSDHQKTSGHVKTLDHHNTLGPPNTLGHYNTLDHHIKTS